MSKKTTLTLIILLLPLFSFAGSSGLYLGAGVGPSYVNTSISDINTDKELELKDSNYGYKFFGGVRGSGFLGVETGYRDFGKVQTDVENVTLSSKTTGWDVYVLGRVEILIIDLFAKAGGLFWKTDSEAYNAADNKSLNYNGTAFAWGFGAGIHFGKLGVRLEWENFQVEHPENLSALTLGLTYGF
jgi:hypothetical protein